MADAHGSGPCVRKDVGVQLPPCPPTDRHHELFSLRGAYAPGSENNSGTAQYPKLSWAQIGLWSDGMTPTNLPPEIRTAMPHCVAETPAESQM